MTGEFPTPSGALGRLVDRDSTHPRPPCPRACTSNRPEETPMHGVIFMHLHQFARQRAGEPAWQDWLKQAGLSKVSFSPVQEYPDAAAVALVESAARTLGAPVPAVLEQFG